MQLEIKDDIKYFNPDPPMLLKVSQIRAEIETDDTAQELFRKTTDVNHVKHELVMNIFFNEVPVTFRNVEFYL